MFLRHRVYNLEKGKPVEMKESPSIVKTKTPVEPVTYRFEEVVELIGVSRNTIERMLLRNEFPQPFRVGRTRLWTRKAIQTWLTSQEAEANRKTASAWRPKR